MMAGSFTKLKLYFLGLAIPATSLRFLPLQLAVIGPEPFVEAIDLLCPTEEVDSFEVKDIVNYCLDNSILVIIIS